METTAIATIIGIIILAAIGLTLALWRKRKMDADALEQNTVRQKFCREIIDTALPWLVTEAEKALGEGTGELKRSWAIQRLVRLLPEKLLAWLPDDLDAMIDSALQRLRPLWKKIPGLIKEEAGIEVTLEEIEPLRVVSLTDLKAGQVAELQRGVAVLLDAATEDNTPAGE